MSTAHNSREVKLLYRILFICHGNICRSPMAEFVMKDMAAKAGAGERFVIDSAATSTEELGNPVYPTRASGAGGAWRGLRAAHGAADDAGGLRQIRPAHRDGQRQHPQYDPHLRRRPGGQNPPSTRLHRPPRRCGRPVVHG